MSRRLLGLGATLAVAVLVSISTGASAAVPPLMERAVLPYTPAAPTSACVVSLDDGDQLVVGLGDGSVVAFHETAGGVFDRMTELPGSGPVDAVLACCMPRPGGSGLEYVILAVRGRELFSLSYDDMRVADRARLAAPSGRYRLAKAKPGSCEGIAGIGASASSRAGIDQAVIYDDDSVARVVVEIRSLALSVQWEIDGAPELAVTSLSDRVIATTEDRMVEFVAESGGVRPPIDERIDLADESPRLAAGPETGDARVLELRASDPDSVWVTRRVSFRDSVAVVASVSDTVMAVGGGTPLTPAHDVGWVALVGTDGRVFASTDHASPVTNITCAGGVLAVQGGGRNLSLYDSNLNPLWDHDSPVDDVVLLAGDFAGDESTDLAVVGTRTYSLNAGVVDSIRFYLDDPEFMNGATRHGNVYALRRAFITVYVSNVGRLETMLSDGDRNAAEAFTSGDIEGALAMATEARAAAAVLGRRGDVAALTRDIADYVSFPRRRTSLLLASLVLVALGAWVAFDCLTGGMTVRVSVVSALLLFATAAAVWRVVGGTGINPLLLLGGAAAMVCAVQAKLRPDAVRRKVAGAKIEELIRVLMEFLHGGGEGVPSEGVVDAARKSMTKVAYLAQEMSDGVEDAERYEMLRERFRSRGEDFLDTTYPRVAVLLSLSRRTGFIVGEVERMARAADRMRDAIAAALQTPPLGPPVMKQQLRALAEARETLAAAADRGWAVVQTNPGCSLTRSIDRILREKDDEFEGTGCRVALTHGVPFEQDAIALWSFELRFILENFVTNALRAMEDSRELALSIETTTDGRTCSIRMSDTGSGMSAETAARLFEARDDERGGGFGLPNSRMRLREAGGDLVVERTAPGEGTTFLMTIPHWTPHTGDA